MRFLMIASILLMIFLLSLFVYYHYYVVSVNGFPSKSSFSSNLFLYEGTLFLTTPVRMLVTFRQKDINSFFMTMQTLIINLGSELPL